MRPHTDLKTREPNMALLKRLKFLKCVCRHSLYGRTDSQDSNTYQNFYNVVWQINPRIV